MSNRNYKRFYEPKHGGSRKALAAAIAWRDQQLAAAKVLTYREFHQQVRSNNRSGVPGVHFLKTERQPRGFWQAMLKLPSGKRTSKTFSVRRFGYRGAFERAVAGRAKMLDLVDDRPYLCHPSAKKVAARQTTFVFDMKAFRLFTQHQTSPQALPKDIQQALGTLSKKNVYYWEMPRRNCWTKCGSASRRPSSP